MVSDSGDAAPMLNIYIYIYVILICLLLFSALIGSGELCFMYFMSDAPVGMSWQLPDDSIFGLFICSLYLIMYFQQFKWFLIRLLLAACILRYFLLLDVLIDICFVFTMYLINLADTIRRYSGYCF